MKRILVQALTVGAIAATAVIFTPACADNDSSIYITAALYPSTNRVNGGCVYTDDPSQTRLFEGLFDLGARDNYVATLLVGSQLMARGDTTNVRAESNRAHILGAIVTVTDPTNGAVLGEFTSTGTGFTNPQQNNTSAFSSLQVTVIDGPTQQKIKALLTNPDITKLVLANIKAFGKTLGGIDLESGEFQLPIRVCRGCLISFATGDDPAVNGIDCNLPLDPKVTTLLPCALGQEEVTPCQLCPSRKACQTPGGL